MYLLFCLFTCHVYTSVCRNQKCLADPLKLNLQAVVSHPTRLMKSDLRSFARAASTVTEEFPTSAELICISIIQKLPQVLPGTRSLLVILAPGSEGREDQEFKVICAYKRSPSHPPPTDRRARHLKVKCPHCLTLLTPGHQLSVLHGKTVEPVRDGAGLEERRHQGHTFAQPYFLSAVSFLSSNAM